MPITGRQRVRALIVGGSFRVESLRSAASSERYVDQADVWDLTFSSLDDADPSVESFDVTELITDVVARQLTVLRSARHDVSEVLRMRPLDDASAMFGTPPGFLPVIDTMVDGGAFGFTLDAEELESMPPQMLLYELMMEGATPADNGYVLPALLRHAINAPSPHVDSAARAALADDLGIERQEDGREPMFGFGVKRRRPIGAPTGWKWRNDASGNGVLGPKDAWGPSTTRRPTSIARALSTAASLVGSAPAGALYCAQEGLVLANKANDGRAICETYAAMVAPLEALDRPRVAARAAALAAC